jgi:hypothetical protein
MYTRTVAEVKELASHDANIMSWYSDAGKGFGERKSEGNNCTKRENLRWPAEYVRRELAGKPWVKKI